MPNPSAGSGCAARGGCGEAAPDSWTAISDEVLSKLAAEGKKPGWPYTKETRSSFAIEGEEPGRTREERFLRALRDASHFHPADKNKLLRFKEEADFVAVFDAAVTAVRTIVDMPDRRGSLLIRLCLQNGGHLSVNKRKQFGELSDEEVERIEAAIREVMRTHSFDAP